MHIKAACIIFQLLIACHIRYSVGKHLLVAYWGQNSAGMKYPENPEKTLKDVCQKMKYDIIVIGFVVTFFGASNKDQMPEVNFANHCWNPVSPEYPNLYKCPKIEEGIKFCQNAGKKLLISLGGATGNNDLDDQKADILAQNLWDLFLGGKGKQNIRPFGSAILDGVDLDIEDHKFGGYAQLVKKLRELEKGAGTRKYLITGAPQCPYPDASLGPKPGTALGDQGSQFDHVYVQFYNNYCHTGDPAQFDPNVKQWLQFAAGAKQAHDWLMVLKRATGTGPKIFVGMPAATGGAGDPKYYRQPEEVEKIYEKLKNEPNFGGFMLWDASWDQQNVINGKMYSDHIADILNRGASPTPGVSSTTTPSVTSPGISPSSEASTTATPTTGGGGGTPQETSPTSGVSTTATPATEGGGEDFCSGKEDGDYADPSNPSGYISCSGGVTYKRKCPAGLVWNDAKKVCDWPQKGQDAKAVYRPLKPVKPFQLSVKPKQQSDQSFSVFKKRRKEVVVVVK